LNSLSQKIHLERLCFNTNFDEYGPRIVDGKFYCLSASIEKKIVFLDGNTQMPFSDLHVLDSCNLIRADFPTWKLGPKTSMNSSYYDGPISGDSTLMFFTSNHGYDVIEKLGIFYAIKINNKWSDPIDFPFNSLRHNVTYPFYDPISKNLYFCSDKGNIDENLDIYVCEFDGKNFSKAKKVLEACSPQNDMSPFFYKNVLYFTSNGFNSIGGYDLFKVENNKTESLGELFNTPFDDLTLVFDTDSTGYFATNRFSDGVDDDIVRFNLYTSTFIPKNEISQTVNFTNSLLDRMYVSLDEDSISNGVLIMDKDIATIGPDLKIISAPFLPPSNGSIILQSDGTYSYTPRANFEGVDSVVVELCKDISPSVRTCHQKTIIFTVNAVNDAPVAMSDRFETPINTPVTMDVLSNDTSVDGELDWNTLKVITSPVNGTVSIDLNKGIITYVPTPGFEGVDNFTYEICDNGIPLPGICSIGTVSVQVGRGVVAETPKLEIKLAPMNVSLKEDTKSKGKLIGSSDLAAAGSGLRLKTTPLITPTNGSILLQSRSEERRVGKECY
jgi:hypothetical protein